MSLSDSKLLAQPSAGLVKTYAEPELRPLSSSFHAPTTAVSPSNATDVPKPSRASASEAVSLAFSPHTPDSLMNTYAAPEPLPIAGSLCCVAPITAVSPSSARENPK